MTRSITIVNTSNWDGEDYLIEIPGSKESVRVRPGESVSFTPSLDLQAANGSCSGIALREDEAGVPVPFEQDTVEVFEGGKWPKVSWRKRKQVFPKVRVTIE